MKKTLSTSPRRVGANRLRPLMLAMCLAGCTTLTLAQLTPRVIDPFTLPDVHRTVGDIKTNPVTTDTLAKLSITQTSSKGVVEFNSLSVGSKAWVDVVAPDANSLTVLRSIGQDPSFIYGRITANDRLFLVNQNGIYVGSEATISTSSLLMSAIDIDPAYIKDDYAKLFADSHLVFTVNSAECGYGGPCSDSSVIEIDTGAKLIAADGGGVMLIGNQGVRNSGDVSTGSGGDITLLATAQAGVDIGDSGFIKLTSAKDASVPGGRGDFTGRTVLNTGTLDAPNGTVTLKTTGYGYGQNVFGDPTGLTTRISEGTPSGVFNTGTIKAQGVFDGKVQSLDDRLGKVVMLAEGPGAVIVNSGKINVSAADARSKAGSISMSAESVLIGNRDGVAELLADGPNGGGLITINNATVTGGESNSLIHVLSGSVLSADATDNGNGGNIKLSTVDGLSDVQLERGSNYGELRAYGTLRARGGVNGGNGGVVETSGSYVNVNDADWGRATIQVNARAAGGAGGVWSLYSPDITIGNRIPSANSQVGQWDTYVNADDINTVLNSGGNVGIGTNYQNNAKVRSGDLIVERGTQFLQSLGGGSNALYLQSGRDLIVQSGTTISSTSGKLNVRLAADADEDGQGSLLLYGQIGMNSGPLAAGRVRAQVQEGDEPITINTNGGLVNLTGAKDPALAGGSPVNDNAGVVISGTIINTQGADGRGDVFIKGAGGVAGSSVSQDATVASQNGVTINGGTDITAGNVNILGNSTSATGVSLSDTVISTDKGTIDIRGVSQGGTVAPAMGQPIGVDIGSGVVLNAGQGFVKILGRGVREAVANAASLPSTHGVRANDLTITTSGDNAGQQIVLVGQSGGSTGAGIQVDSGAPGIRLNDEASTVDNVRFSAADMVIGASADAMAPKALNLGTFAPNTTGRRNFRPAGVDAEGNVTESLTTAIRVGGVAGGVPTNFIINPAWLGQLAVIGSSIQKGQISVEAGALNGAGTITLQNDGAGSQGIDLGAQTGNNTGLTLNLVTAGDITQSGPLNVGQLQVIASPQSKVSLADPGNQIANAIYDNRVLTPQINAQALPQADTTSGLLGYSVNVEAPGNNAFIPLSVNYTYANNEMRPYKLPEDRPRLQFESVDALNELRTDVYLHGQFSRPQLCTPANTSGAQLAGLTDVEPLTMEWTKVRRGAQLTNCSGVQADGNCSAF